MCIGKGGISGEAGGHLVPGGALPDRPGAGLLRHLACGRTAGAATGALARYPRGLGRGLGAIHRDRGAGHDRPGPPQRGGRGELPARAAALLLAAGIICGIAGLFPGYIGGLSLARQPAELVPHLIYLGAWAASALLVLAGGVRPGSARPGSARLQAGALLGIGTSVITFGLFVADVGQVIAGGAHLFDFGLLLSLASWLGCTAGAVAAVRLQPAGAPLRPHRPGPGAVLTLGVTTLAALGAAVTFAPSWDSYTLRTAAGAVQSLTAGNSFANPAPVITGDVAVMVALVGVAAAAALWRPARLGAVLLAGALIPMAAQAISALVQTVESTSPAQFGISPAQAAQADLTISNGLTPVFWVYCAFVIALAAICLFLSAPPRRVPDPAAPPPPPGLEPAGAWQAPASPWQAAADPGQAPAGPGRPPRAPGRHRPVWTRPSQPLTQAPSAAVDGACGAVTRRPPRGRTWSGTRTRPRDASRAGCSS